MWPFDAYREAPRADTVIARRTLRYFQQPTNSVFGIGAVQTSKSIKAGNAGSLANHMLVISGVPGNQAGLFKTNPLNKV